MTPISKTAFSALALALVLTGVAAHAQAPSGAEAVKARQDKYKQIGKAAKGIGDALKTPSPSVPALQAYAKQIDVLAPQVQSWFPRGSGPEAGVKTGAKAEIWQKPDEFKRDAAGFITAAHKLDTVAATGDVNQIRASFNELGQTCKTCHQAFRARED